jgi:glycosyltransferase involved in cell wall biosynthesis
MLRMRMSGENYTHDTATLGADPEGDNSVRLSSVLLVTPRWVRDGGVGAHVQASAALLAREGLEVHVLAAQVEPGEAFSGLTIHTSPELFNADAPMDVRLGEAGSLQPSVTHLHQVDDAGIVQFMQRLSPVVISAHGYTACTSGVYYFQPGEECTRGHGPGCVPNLIARGCAHAGNRKTMATMPRRYREVTRRLEALRRADLAVSYSSAVDRHLAANGITHRTIVPYFPTMAAKPGSGHDTRRRVVFAGRIVGSKGVDVLIRAARNVEAEFIICGEGRRLDDMRRLAEELGIGERVRFAGWLDADRLAEEFANASLVVIPSLWPEPFGLVGIEALAAGRPAVASSTGGIVDWLEHGVSGLCVPPGDELALARALNELLADPGMQQTMGAAGRRAVAERFSPETHVTALVKGYRGARSRWQSGARLTTAHA